MKNGDYTRWFEEYEARYNILGYKKAKKNK